MSDDEQDANPYQVDYLDGEKEHYNWIPRAGKLKITYPNGDTFEGYYDENKLKQGFGNYRWQFTKPEGEEEEEPEEEPPEEGEEGTQVIRRKKKNYPHFEGLYVDGKRKGKGVLYTKTGEMYYGEWDNDLFNGRGVYKYKNGDIYDGYWVNGKKEGEGTYCVANNGNKLQGLWFKNNIIEGKWYFKDGTYFEGKFENNNPYEAGTIKFHHGAERKGEFYHKARDDFDLCYNLVWKTYAGQK